MVHSVTRPLPLLALPLVLIALPGCQSDCEKLHDRKVALVDALEVPSGDVLGELNKHLLRLKLLSDDGREASISACAKMKPEAIKCGLEALDLRALERCGKKPQPAKPPGAKKDPKG